MLTPAHMQLQPSVLQSAQLAQSKQSQAQQQAQNQQHSRRASHSGIPRIGTPAVTLGMMSPVPVLAGGTHQAAAHPMLPNPATTITPNMPFADMGKGLPYQSLTKGTRVFVVQFKGKRCDLYFAPNRGMEHKVIPTLAPTAAKDGAGTGTSAMPAPVPPKSRDSEAKSAYEPGTYVLVEADRGVDLGVIREELLGTETVLAFSSGSADASPGGFSDHSTLDGDDAAGDHGGLARPTSSKDVYVKRIFRAADQREVADLLGNKVLDEQNALSMCQTKVQQRKLSMCVVDAEFQFDRRKLTFYFTADRRVDFRELVRDLFKHFKTRIWMCQQTS
ncbi:hypothetical protein IWW52_004972 [Coemansia sp. RSA 2704]|nr:hypothetical protein IWW54_005221 [Coemansia sp. RSA 2705]KAJ2312009.1 hypothetical protein IWW52_004972 [Coemansia sp. RSA 2704]